MTLQIQDPVSQTWVNIGGVRDFTGPNTTRSEIDVTTLCSDAKEYLLDLKDNGTFTANLLFCPGNGAQRLLMAGLDTETAYGFRVIFPAAEGEMTLEFAALVQSFPITASQGAAITVALSLRITGEVAWSFPDGDVRLNFSTMVLEEDSGDEGVVSGSIAVTLTGDTFTGMNGSPVPGVSFMNVPAGLDASMIRDGEKKATIFFTGKALTHASGTTATVEVTFGNESFTGGSVMSVVGANNRSITINFI